MVHVKSCAREIGSKCYLFVKIILISIRIKTKSSRQNEMKRNKTKGKKLELKNKVNKALFLLSFNWFDHVLHQNYYHFFFFSSGFGRILFWLPIQLVETMFIESNCLASTLGTLSFFAVLISKTHRNNAHTRNSQFPTAVIIVFNKSQSFK